MLLDDDEGHFVDPKKALQPVINEFLRTIVKSGNPPPPPHLIPKRRDVSSDDEDAESGASPAKRPEVSGDDSWQKGAIKPGKAPSESEMGGESDGLQDTRRKLEFSATTKPSTQDDSERPSESEMKHKRVSLATPSFRDRSHSHIRSPDSPQVSSPPGSDVAGLSPHGRDHDYHSAVQSLAHFGSLGQRTSKIFRRNYDDAADAAPDTVRARSTSAAGPHGHHRLSASQPAAEGPNAPDIAERRHDAMAAKAREQMERESWLDAPAKADDVDEDLLRYDLKCGEAPGEWPPLRDMRRAWTLGWEYSTVYKGTWGPYNTAEGRGILTRPFKVEYEGEFQDGMCHGAGALHYPNGAVIRGTWDRGRLLQPAYIASDGLNFDPDGPYCMVPDRRFYTEIQYGLRPAGRSQLTNAHPPRWVPPGCYDAGDGIFDPRKNCIYDPNTLEVVRVPTKSQMEWIKENCRKGWDENVGYRPDLFENWLVESPPASAAAEELEEEEEEEEPEQQLQQLLQQQQLEQEMLQEQQQEQRLRKVEEENEEWRAWLDEEARRARAETTMEERFDAEFVEEPLPAVVTELYPPNAVQDVALDATPPEDIYPFLFPETEEGETVQEKLMLPVSTEVTQENVRMRQRYQNALEAERGAMEARELMEKRREEEAKAKEAAAKAKAESPPATPRLSLDETEEVYKGPWRHVARRLVPMLRQRLEADRRTAAKKWQEDLVRLLTERDAKAGLEMSTTGYLGAAKSVEDLKRPRTSRVIIPPGLEERARQRRADREQREREAEEKRQAEAHAKQAAKEQGLRDAAQGSDSDDEADREPSLEPDSHEREVEPTDEDIEAAKRRPSVLPASALATPKGGRVSLAQDERVSSSSVPPSMKKSLTFKNEENEKDEKDEG